MLMGFTIFQNNIIKQYTQSNYGELNESEVAEVKKISSDIIELVNEMLPAIREQRFCFSICGAPSSKDNFDILDKLIWDLLVLRAFCRAQLTQNNYQFTLRGDKYVIMPLNDRGAFWCVSDLAYEAIKGSIALDTLSRLLQPRLQYYNNRTMSLVKMAYPAEYNENVDKCRVAYLLLCEKMNSIWFSKPL